LFDFAFKQYAQRWKFKRPMPADFFRTMEDASGVDLDWFWHGWFYTIDHVDISIERVRLFQPLTGNPEIDKGALMKERSEQPRTLTEERNKTLPKRVDEFPSLRDFYNTYDELVVTERDREQYRQFLQTLTPRERELLQTGLNFYVVDLKNIGGLVSPVILDVEYTDGTHEVLRIPAEIWRYNSTEVSKLIMTDKEVRSISLDPRLETTDVDLANNNFPRRPVKSRFQLFKEGQSQPNAMQLELRQATPIPTPVQ
jgi:hypothetical protein